MANLDEFERLYQQKQQAKAGTLSSPQPPSPPPVPPPSLNPTFIKAGLEAYDYSDPQYRDQVAIARDNQDELQRLSRYHRGLIDNVCRNIRGSTTVHALQAALVELVTMKRRLHFGSTQASMALKVAIERIYDTDIRVIQTQINSLRLGERVEPPTVYEITDTVPRLRSSVTRPKPLEFFKETANKVVDTIKETVVKKDNYFEKYPTFNPHVYGVSHSLVLRVAEAAEAIYPDRWDMEKSMVGTVNLIIHFPEFKIRNGAGLSRTIYDLYVKFEIDERIGVPFIHGQLQGRRATFTTQEYHSDYAHSHLSGLCPNGYQEFCMGSDTVLAIAAQINSKTSLYKSSPQKWSIMFESLLLQIGEYIQYENTGGNPYRYLKNVGNINNTRVHISTDQARIFVNACASRYKYLADVIDFTIDPISGLPSIVQTEEYELALSNCTNIWQNRDRFGAYHDIGGQARTTSGAPDYSGFEPLIFRGNRIQFKTYNITSNEDDNNRTNYCHRTLKSIFERRICGLIHGKILMLSAERVHSERVAYTKQLGESVRTLKALLKNISIVPEDKI